MGNAHDSTTQFFGHSRLKRIPSVILQRSRNLSSVNQSASVCQTSRKRLDSVLLSKDNTSGCSVQAQDFSQHLTHLQQLGYQVIGVSRDSVKSHEKFIANQQINFALVSDTDEQLCQYFDIIAEKNCTAKSALAWCVQR
ncbi:MAG: peroxiredoxin [Moraxella osloensis]